MKNFFKYANKELTQDIFLRWVFENYEDPELEKVVKKFLKQIFNIDENKKISDLKTNVQEQKIDLSIHFNIGTKKYALYTEDKTFSGEHDDQFDKYSKKLYEEGIETIFLYYKTFYISQEEKDRLEKVNDKYKGKMWVAYDLEDLCQFFKEFNESSNFILKQYIENIEQLKLDLNNQSKPKQDDSIYKWEGYFNNTILKGLNKEIKDKFEFYVGKAGRFPYINIWINLKGFNNTGARPNLEIRSRDCFEDKIVVRFVNYHKEPPATYKEKLHLIIEKLTNDNVFSIKRIDKKRPRQIGVYEKDNIKTDQEFICEVEKCAKYLLEVINSFWG